MGKSSKSWSRPAFPKRLRGDFYSPLPGNRPSRTPTNAQQRIADASVDNCSRRTPPVKNSPLSGTLAILTAATLFGVAGGLAKALFHAGISPLTLTAIRMLLSCALFAGVIATLLLLASAGLAFTAKEAQMVH